MSCCEPKALSQTSRRTVPRLSRRSLQDGTARCNTVRPLLCGYHAVCLGYRAVRDTVDGMARGIPCRAGYRAVRDTVPCGIPCRAGYCAERDTVPCAILCPLRVPLCVCVGWRADALDSVRVVPLGWAPCQGRSPHARTGFRSIRRKWAPLSAAVAWKHRLSGANSVAGEQRILSSYAFRRARDMADPKATRAQLDRLRGGPGLGR